MKYLSMAKNTLKSPTMTKRTKNLIGEVLDPNTKTFRKTDVVYMLWNMGFVKRQVGSHQNWSHKILGLNYTLVDPSGSAKGKQDKVIGKAIKELKTVVKSYMEVNKLVDYSDLPSSEEKINVVEQKEDDDMTNSETILQAITVLQQKQETMDTKIEKIKGFTNIAHEKSFEAILKKQTEQDKQIKATQDLLIDLGARIEELGLSISKVQTQAIAPSGPKLSAAQKEKLECIKKLKEAIAKYPEFKDNPSLLYNLTGVSVARIKAYAKAGELD